MMVGSSAMECLGESCGVVTAALDGYEPDLEALVGGSGVLPATCQRLEFQKSR